MPVFNATIKCLTDKFMSCCSKLKSYPESRFSANFYDS